MKGVTTTSTLRIDSGARPVGRPLLTSRLGAVVAKEVVGFWIFFSDGAGRIS